MTHYYRAHKFKRGQRLKTCAMLQYINIIVFKFYTAFHQILQSSSSSSSLLTTQNSWRESRGAVSERCSERSLVSSWAAFTRCCQLPLPRCLTLKDWKHSLHVKLTVSLLSCMYPINDLQNSIKCTERGWGRYTCKLVSLWAQTCVKLCVQVWETSVASQVRDVQSVPVLLAVCLSNCTW